MTGIGRGRGWLKLGKPDEQKIGVASLQSPTSSKPILEDFSKYKSKQMMPLHEKLVNAINQFNENDDGISINYKLKTVLQIFTDECHNENEARDAFFYSYNYALENEQFVTKFIIFTTTKSFNDLKLFKDNFRLLYIYINKMQEDYENAQNLADVNKIMFHNAIRILNGYYNVATTHVCALPLLNYFNMLIDIGQPDDIELFTSQLPLTGYKIYETNEQLKKGINDLLIKVRNVLITGKNLTEKSKVLLLLTLDLGINEFRMLHPDLLNFYQMKAGDKPVMHMQKSLSTLSIETHNPSHVTDNYNSDVNVLLVDTTLKPNIEPQTLQQNQFNKKSPKFNHSKPKEEMYSTWDSNTNNRRKPSNKAGRPILGAGARNFKDNTQQDKYEENSTGWDVKQKNTEGSGWGGEKHQNRNGFREPRSNKGWEHDDRFETDYN